jgi:hypothetical protein
MLCPRRDFYEKSGDGGLRNDFIITSSLYARVQHDAPKSAACMSSLDSIENDMLIIILYTFLSIMVAMLQSTLRGNNIAKD